MRPVNKGNNRGTFNPYTNAQQPLIDQLGDRCSYCERWIPSSIHVEHKKPKDHYPEVEFQWSNFLLACGNCNSSKGSTTFNLNDYIWPDTDNTMRAFKYQEEGRILPATGFENTLDDKIKNTWKLFGLHRHPDTTNPDFLTPTIKDKRWLHRKGEWEKATKNKNRLLETDTITMREMIVEAATAKGMFSIWFTVFSDDIDIKRRLITAFTNTDKDCFDQVFFTPIARQGGQV